MAVMYCVGDVVSIATDTILRQAISLFLLSLAILNVFSYYPIDRLGERSGSKSMNMQCILGYDSSLGSMHPILKCIYCGIVYLVLYAGFILVGIWIGTSDVVVMEYLATWFIGDCAHAWMQTSQMLAIMGTVGIVYALYQLGQCVSYPGEGREHKIRRVPKWDAKVTELDATGWRCAVAEDSHRVTMDQLKEDESSIALTGEPAGRQIWTYEETSVDNSTEESPKSFIHQWFEKQFNFDDSKNETVSQEEYVQILASGGREYTGFDPSKNPNSGDRLFRAQQIRNALKEGEIEPPSLSSKPKTAEEAAKKGFQFYAMLQTEDGHWAADYGGPHFLMPGMIIAWYIMGKPNQLLNEFQRKMMLHYLTVHQQSDGGWGTHIESPSTMFCTVLCYIAVRLLGDPADCERCEKARNFIKNEGGAIYTSSWAKFWLCLLGCMEWEGHNSVPPEMWMLPNWFPFHPGRLWCHCRMVYLPMGYLYGSRFVYPNAYKDSLIASLREELYCESYNDIKWSETRNYVAPMDNYSPLPLFMKIVNGGLAIYETFPLLQPFKNFVRTFGLQFSVEYMKAEDLQTNFIDIGPVNKVLNMVSAYHASGYNNKCEEVKKHMMRAPDYLWLAEDGMKMQGYNGSQCWDTSFAIQAMSECKLLDTFPSTSSKVWSYLERTQILSTKTSQASPAFDYESAENRNQYYRHVSKGGWPFSTSAHGWPISDCTGEGLKAVLCLKKNSKVITKGIENGELRDISDERLFDAVNVMLTLQNEDGGWATYENNRGFGWYEQLNPSEVFGDIMIDYSYVECSMATLTGLAEFHHQFPNHRREEITTAIKQGSDFIKRIQRPDGSWYGSWAW